MPLAGIPEELLDKVRIANYLGAITKEDIDTYIADPEKDTITQDISYWNSWTNELQLIWDNALQASPYMWTARIIMDDTLCDTLPTLTVNGRVYYPKPYDDNQHQVNTAYGDSRASSSPTPKRIRMDPTVSP